jgi:hypothetical protein
MQERTAQPGNIAQYCKTHHSNGTVREKITKKNNNMKIIKNGGGLKFTWQHCTHIPRLLQTRYLCTPQQY